MLNFFYFHNSLSQEAILDDGDDTAKNMTISGDGDFFSTDSDALMTIGASNNEPRTNWTPVMHSRHEFITDSENATTYSQPRGNTWLSAESDDDDSGQGTNTSAACRDFCEAGQLERNNQNFRFALYENERPSTWTEPPPPVTIKKGDILLYNNLVFPNVNIWSKVLDGKMVKGFGITFPEITLCTGYVLQPHDTIKILSYRFNEDGKWDKKSGSSVQLKNLNWEERDHSV